MAADEFSIGEEVVTDDGLFTGKVTEIDGRIAVVFVDIFGSSREISVALAKLIAA